jgi:hypothetical protein
MGLFKVLIVITILNYQGIQATMITQALIVGAALPNYFSILVRKHPILPTSLVNFNLVFILVPCTLNFGLSDHRVHSEPDSANPDFLCLFFLRVAILPKIQKNQVKATEIKII